MKYAIVLAFVAILGSLGAALFWMLKRGPDPARPDASKRMARALLLRVGLSVLLFVLVLAGYWLGWLHPSAWPQR